MRLAMKQAVICAALILGTGILAARTSLAPGLNTARLSQQQQPQQQQGQPTQQQNAAPIAAPPPQSGGAVLIGGEPAIILTRPRSLDANKPQFLQMVVLPGMGMNLLQLKAYLPGKGDIDLISTMDLPSAKTVLESNNELGNNSFAAGAAFLLPYAGRIRGKLSPDGKTISTVIDGHRLSLPANWHGPEPGAEPVAMNGLILTSKFQDLRQHNGPTEATVSAKLHAGNFGGQWLSSTDITIGATLKDASLDVYVLVKNVGDEEDPIGIGFLPHFLIPSGDRKQARVEIPADMRALVGNYDDAFPTGRIISAKAEYDFTAPEGKPLDDLSLADCFTDLQKDDNGNEAVELTDPVAKYGLRMRIFSPHIKALEVEAPLDKNFVAIDPQFNLPDPYNARIWRGQDTGMVVLQAGRSAMWYVRLELFTPR
jgi:aldose 1-epimerase